MADTPFKGPSSFAAWKCKGKTQTGADCQSKRVLSSGYCRHHETPEARQAREEAARDQLKHSIEKTLARSRRRTAKLERRNAKLKRLLDGIREGKSVSEIQVLLGTQPDFGKPSK